MKLAYRENVNSEFVKGFGCAEWGRNVINRKFIKEYCFQIYNCIVSMCYKQEACCFLQVEYIALSQCTSEGYWLHNLPTEIKVNGYETFVNPIYGDNQSGLTRIIG